MRDCHGGDAECSGDSRRSVEPSACTAAAAARAELEYVPKETRRRERDVVAGVSVVAAGRRGIVEASSSDATLERGEGAILMACNESEQKRLRAPVDVH